MKRSVRANLGFGTEGVTPLPGFTSLECQKACGKFNQGYAEFRVMDLSEYILEPLRKHEDFTLYRGRHRDSDKSEHSILLVAPLLPSSASSGVRQAEHGSSLEPELGTASDVRPGVAQYPWQPVLVLENARGEILDALVQKTISTGYFLQIALEKALDEIKCSDYRLEGENRPLPERVVQLLRDKEGKVPKFVGATTDIDDQKRTKEALRASEAGLRRVIDNIPGLVSTLAPDGETESVNRQMLEYFGKTPEELKNWRLSDAIHPDDLPRIIALHAQSIKPGVSFGSECRLRRFDGVYRWFQFRAELVRDGSGSVSGWYVLAIDIHDRKRAEEALQASERNFASIINTIPTPAWSARPDGYCDFLSQGWLDFTGLSLELAQGWGWTNAIHPEDRDKLVQDWQSAIATGLPIDTVARLRRFDGVYRWTLIRGNPWRDGSGSIVKWYGTNIDIDDRKSAEEALRASEANLRRVIDTIPTLYTDIDDRKRAEEELRLREINLRQITETIPEMLWSAGADGMIDYCNGRLLSYAGISSRDIIGTGWTKIFHPDDVESWIQSWKSSVETGHPYHHEVRTLHGADQKYRWCVTSALPLHDDDGNIVKWHGTVVDMHDWKQAEEELRDTQAELAKMTRITSMGELTASIAHEVNQPLSGIMTNANTCLRMLNASPPNTEGARETARRIIRDGNRASDVIARLRSLFCRKEVVAESVDLNEATREVIALMLGELQKSSVIVTHEYADHLPILKGDRIQLQQVILNLIRNASDAMACVENRPKRLIFRTEKVGDYVKLTVQDSGLGFDPAIADQMFESFYSTKAGGMGIGLSVCRSIIEAHHGRLWATPNQGHGATFAFAIPWKGGD